MAKKSWRLLVLGWRRCGWHSGSVEEQRNIETKHNNRGCKRERTFFFPFFFFDGCVERSTHTKIHAKQTQNKRKTNARQTQDKQDKHKTNTSNKHAENTTTSTQDDTQTTTRKNKLSADNTKQTRGSRKKKIHNTSTTLRSWQQGTSFVKTRTIFL